MPHPATKITDEPAAATDVLDRKLSLAPMMGCTDRHCRYLFRLISPHTLMYSEMLTTGALIYGNKPHFLAHGGDEPCALQLGGSDPDELARCAVMAQDAGYAEVNLNVGCPSDRVQNGGIGACLMATPQRVADCVTAMQAAVRIPVTVKTRIGIDDMEGFDPFAGFIDTVYHGGCRIFIIHARKALLAGLSPKDNREIPPLHYDYVYRIREQYPDCTFILNGGINSSVQAVELMPRVDGLMLGRAPYANPYLLAELEAALYGHQAPDRLSVLTTYLDYMANQRLRGEPLKHMARHLLGWFTGIPGARAFRRHLSTHMFEEDAGVDVVTDAIDVARLAQQYQSHDALRYG